MSIIIKRYLQDNWSNIFFRIIILLYSIPGFIIYKSDNILLVKIIAYIIIISVIVMLIVLCCHKEFKITISIKDLIKSNRNKDYQYQKLIKEKKYDYTRYIKYIDKDIQLEIFDELNKIKLLHIDQFSLDIYLMILINPCYEIICKAIEKDPNYFNYINNKCDNYNEYKELYEFITI